MMNVSKLWERMMLAARNAAIRRGWREAARIRRDWTEWYYRQLPGGHRRGEPEPPDLVLHE